MLRVLACQEHECSLAGGGARFRNETIVMSCY